MNTTLKTVLVAAMLGSIVLLSGCSAVSAPEKEDPSGTMGMSPEGVWGYVADSSYAALEMSKSQLDADVLVVDRVLAPADAWLVVHLSEGGKPGARVGLQHVDKGESTSVEVELDGVTTPDVIVALHADKGDGGVFDFDMDDMMGSPDRPYFVDGAELAVSVAVRTFGVKATSDEAALSLSDQPGASDELVVDSVTVPGPAWLVVHLNDDGMPGKRVGYRAVLAGTTTDVRVPLRDTEDADSFLVAVHADRGDEGVLDFDMEDMVGSPDQPYFIDGVELAGAVSVE